MNDQRPPQLAVLSYWRYCPNRPQGPNLPAAVSSFKVTAPKPRRGTAMDDETDHFDQAEGNPSLTQFPTKHWRLRQAR